MASVLEFVVEFNDGSPPRTVAANGADEPFVNFETDSCGVKIQRFRWWRKPGTLEPRKRYGYTEVDPGDGAWQITDWTPSRLK